MQLYPPTVFKRVTYIVDMYITKNLDLRFLNINYLQRNLPEHSKAVLSLVSIVILHLREVIML